MPSTKPYYIDQVQNAKIEDISDIKTQDATEILLKLLALPSIADKSYVTEQYDHMVQTNTVVLPGRGDAAVLRIKGSSKKLALTTDCNSRYCYLDPYTGGQIAVAEAARNLVCTGATPIAVTDCLNFGNPEKPEMFWQFEQAVKGLAEACRAFDTPVISGNVSLYNESSSGVAIYPTPVVGMLGLIEGDVSHLDMSFKSDGDLIILLGTTRNALGGTEFLKLVHGLEVGMPPTLDMELEKSVQQTCLEANKQNLLKSAHDTAEGGLIVALAECCIAGNIGAHLDIKALSRGLRLDTALFSESQSRIIVTIEKLNLNKLEQIAAKHKVPYEILGKVSGKSLLVRLDGEETISLEVSKLAKTFTEAIPNLMKGC